MVTAVTAPFFLSGTVSCEGDLRNVTKTHKLASGKKVLAGLCSSPKGTKGVRVCSEVANRLLHTLFSF